MNPWFSSILIIVCSYGYWSPTSVKGFKGIFEDVQRKDYKSDLKWLLCTEQWKWKNRWLKEIWKRSSRSWGAVKKVEIHFSLSVPKKIIRWYQIKLMDGSYKQVFTWWISNLENSQRGLKAINSCKSCKSNLIFSSKDFFHWGLLNTRIHTLLCIIYVYSVPILLPWHVRLEHLLWWAKQNQLGENYFNLSPIRNHVGWWEAKTKLSPSSQAWLYPFTPDSSTFFPRAN